MTAPKRTERSQTQSAGSVGVAAGNGVVVAGGVGGTVNWPSTEVAVTEGDTTDNVTSNKGNNTLIVSFMVLSSL